MSDNIQTVYIKELDPDIIPPSTSNYKDKEQGGSKIVVIGKPGCFSKGTEILMYNGNVKNVEDVQVNEKVMGPDSKPRTVIELCRNRDEMFKIVPEYGECYTVNKKHKLVLYSFIAKTTIEIAVDEYLEASDEWKENWLIFRASVDFPHIDYGEDFSLYDYGLTLETQQFFTNSYRKGDKLQRLELLAGIIDGSDVVFDCKWNRQITITKPILAKYNKELLFIARSLGFHASFNKISLIIRGNLHEIPFRKTRLPENGHPLLITESDRYCKFSIESQGEDDYYGFTIDGDHRFLLGSFDVVRNTGKTTIIKSLLYLKKHIIPVGMVMSGTEDSNGSYKQLFPSTFVFNKYGPDQVKKFVQRQKIAKQHIENPWAVLILDDCTDNPSLFKKPLQQSMYKNGRHWKMLYILSLQYGLDVQPVIRTNVDGVFILREPNLRNRKVMYENYGGGIPSLKIFCELMDELTSDYCAMYIKNASGSNNWWENVFWYKATPAPDDFKFGCPEYWEFHFERYNSEYVDPIIV